MRKDGTKLDVVIAGTTEPADLSGERATGAEDLLNTAKLLGVQAVQPANVLLNLVRTHAAEKLAKLGDLAARR